MHFMLQREVVERIAAAPGDDAYGRLTVMLAPWVTAELLCSKSAPARSSRPQVWSAVVRLTVRSEAAFPVSAHFGAVVVRGLLAPAQDAAQCAAKTWSRASRSKPAASIPASVRKRSRRMQFNALAQTLEAQVR